MRAVLVRELTVMARTPALAFAIGLQVALLAGYVCLWSGGIPGVAANLYEQQHIFHLWVLVALLPWTAARCMAPDGSRRLAFIAAVTARRPGSLLVSKVVAVTAGLLMVLVSGIPATIVAQQMSAMPVSRLIPDAVAMSGLAVLTAACAVAATLLLRGRLAPWIAATVPTALAVVLLPPWMGAVPAGAAALVASAIITLTVAAWSNNSSRYVDA